MNAWPTPARFGSSAPCPFCQVEEDGARLEHLVACPALRDAAAPLFRGWHGRWPLGGGITDAIAWRTPPQHPAAALSLIWLDIVLQTYLAMKHGGTAGLPSLIRGRIRAISRHSSFSRYLLKSAYQGSLNV